IPGVRSVASVRDSLPKPHAAGAAKQEVLNQFVTWPPPEDLLHPETTFGRTLETPRLAASNAVAGPAHVIFSGNPRWNVVMPPVGPSNQLVKVSVLVNSFELV